MKDKNTKLIDKIESKDSNKEENPSSSVKEHDHELKSIIGLFEPIFNEEKTNDLRNKDRDYKIGNVCLLREYDSKKEEYTGKETLIEIIDVEPQNYFISKSSPEMVNLTIKKLK